MHSLYKVEIIYVQYSFTYQNQEDSEHTGRLRGGGKGILGRVVEG